MSQKDTTPPKLVRRILLLQEHFENGYALTGDCSEEYKQILQRRGKARALIWVWRQALCLLVFSFRRSLFLGGTMFGSYWKAALRNIQRHKGYSLINISGLALGMACFILILLWMQHELSYDKHHRQADQIYRACIYSNFSGNELYSAKTPAPLAAALREEFPEVAQTARFLIRNRNVRFGEQNFREKRFTYADPSIFSVFTLPFVQGDPQHALNDPYSVVLTEAAAGKYFPSKKNPLGKILKINDEDTYQITGIVEDVPSSSHFHFDFLASISSLPQIERLRDNWDESFLYTYFVLAEQGSAEQLEAKFPQMVEKYIGPDIQKAFGMSIEEWSEKSGNSFRYYVQRLRDIHLRSNLMGEIEANGDIRYVVIFFFIGLATLVIAGINFINLATARSLHRAKDVGIRKVLGSDKTKLISQFLTNSIFLSLCACLIAVILAVVFLPILNHMVHKDLTLNILEKPELLGYLAGLVLAVGILAGAYPALYFASLHPMGALRGRIRQGGKKSAARKGLVLFQFSITITILVCTVVVYQQLLYMQNKKLGFQKEHVLVIPRGDVLGARIDVFKDEIENNASIVYASATSSVPGEEFDSHSVCQEGSCSEKRQVVAYLESDENFCATYGLELKEGRFFSRDFSTETKALLLNESAVSALGLEEPIGKKIGTVTPDRTIIGIVKDFHFSSVREKIGPLAIYRTNQGWDHLSVRLRPENLSQSVQFLKQKWERFVQSEPFDFYFLDEKINDLYRFEQNIGRLAGIFSCLAVSIACLGLLGLAAFTAERYTKEIGIRKVLGASISSIVFMQSKEFTKWVLAANAVAWPLAYYLMHHWLQNYAYRVDLNLGIFVLSAAATYVLALLTVSYFSIRSALVNPIHSLGTE